MLDLCGLGVDEFSKLLDLIVFGLEFLFLLCDLGLKFGNQLFEGGLRVFGLFVFEL